MSKTGKPAFNGKDIDWRNASPLAEWRLKNQGATDGFTGGKTEQKSKRHEHQADFKNPLLSLKKIELSTGLEKITNSRNAKFHLEAQTSASRRPEALANQGLNMWIESNNKGKAHSLNFPLKLRQLTADDSPEAQIHANRHSAGIRWQIKRQT